MRKQLVPVVFFQKKANGPQVFQRCGGYGMSLITTVGPYWSTFLGGGRIGSSYNLKAF
jgi:hypothetical protein